MRTIEEIKNLTTEQQADILRADVKKQVYEKFSTDAEAFVKLPPLYQNSKNINSAREALVNITFYQRFGVVETWGAYGESEYKKFIRKAFLQFDDELEAVDVLPQNIRRLLHEGVESPDARGLIASMWVMEAKGMLRPEIADTIQKGIQDFHERMKAQTT
jgi:hypothetical protein